MESHKTDLPGVVVIQPRVIADARGFFQETFRADAYARLIGDDRPFVQDNHSRSARGVLRGLHLQTRRPQGKLVRCVRGEVFDACVDVRPASSTFGRWFGLSLSGDNHRQLYVPPGYAHGFVVLSEWADVEYKCTDYYDPDGESGLIWNDPDVGIDWPVDDPKLSARDQALPSLHQIRTRT